MAGQIDEGYTREQVKAVLKASNVEVASETEHDIIAYCPFHRNSETPSFSVSHINGKYICFNPSCQSRGNLTFLVAKMTGRNKHEARRFISKKEGETRQSFADRIKLEEHKEELPEFSQSKIDELVQQFDNSDEAKQYMQGRGFSLDTCKYFEVGHSAKKDMITVPMHDQYGKPVGLIGRGIKDRQFKNSLNLPRNHVLWNIHRAKRHGSIVILTEAAFDAMRVHQAGYPNVIATAGGSLSILHFKLLERFFDKIIIMTDYDNKQYSKKEYCRRCDGSCTGHRPGRDLGMKIVGALQNHDIFWASEGPYAIYPEGCKDACDMTDEQIKQVIENSVTHLEFNMWLEDGLVE